MTSVQLQLWHELGRHVDIATSDGTLLFRYVYAPDSPVREARRPYAHPLCSRAGDVLTNFRPNDHPWHHGLSLTITRVGGVNFWGGPSYRAGDGYQWREDHGVQVHRAWTALLAERLEETVEWCDARGDVVMLRERRELSPALTTAGWSLRWHSELVNVSGRELVLGNYHSSDGLAGSHYTGLQFRGARDLLDEHGDVTIGVTDESGLKGEAQVHGVNTRWIEWSCQHDGSLRRTRIRFENPESALPWFVRPKNPLTAFAFHREHDQSLAPGATLRLQHLLSFNPA
jgi:hypothetical protein